MRLQEQAVLDDVIWDGVEQLFRDQRRQWSNQRLQHCSTAQRSSIQGQAQHGGICMCLMYFCHTQSVAYDLICCSRSVAAVLAHVLRQLSTQTASRLPLPQLSGWHTPHPAHLSKKLRDAEGAPSCQVGTCRLALWLAVACNCNQPSGGAPFQLYCLVLHDVLQCQITIEKYHK